MDAFNTHHIGDIPADERRAFVRFSAVLARQDEARLWESDVASIHHSGAARREAIAIAGLEGALVRMESLATLIADPEETSVDRGAQLALGIYNALWKSFEWSGKGPELDEVSYAFKTSDAAHGRLMRADAVWSLEDDCEWMVNELSRIAETPEPWTVVEVIRSIWSSGRFFGNSRRMAMIATPWALMTGFGLDSLAWGVTQGISKDIDNIRNASSDKDTWSALFADSASNGVESELTAFRNVPAMITSLKALCPPGRSSSSIEGAIRFFIKTPVCTTKSFSKALDLSDRGAKVVLDKLTDTNVLDVEGGARNRKFVCRRTM